MTDTPHLHALAMRTKAAAHCKQVAEDCKKYNLPQAAGMVSSVGRDILALPLEADHTALLREAVKLPEVAALIRDAKAVSFANNHGQGLQGWYEAMDKIDISLQPFLALETP